MQAEHEYHGLTFRTDGTGWVIQIRLLGKYHIIRAFADSAEQAARRHDIALSKLDAFTDDNARPNFPDDFKEVDISRSADASESFGKFYDALHAKFSQLNHICDEAGLDVSQIRAQRDARAKVVDERRAQKRDALRTAFRLALLRQKEQIFFLQLDEQYSQRLNGLMKTMLETLTDATE